MYATFTAWWQERRERPAHRETAFNCRYWIGDNGFVDEGECPLCPPWQPDAR